MKTSRYPLDLVEDQWGYSKGSKRTVCKPGLPEQKVLVGRLSGLGPINPTGADLQMNDKGTKKEPHGEESQFGGSCG